MLDFMRENYYSCRYEKLINWRQKKTIGLGITRAGYGLDVAIIERIPLVGGLTSVVLNQSSYKSLCFAF